jgi:hypothetical protein
MENEAGKGGKDQLIINGLGQAWINIPEPQKINFLQKLAKEDDMNLANLLKRRAKLIKENCSQKYILSRNTNTIRRKMDDYFLTDDGQFALLNFAYRFFNQISQCLDEQYLCQLYGPPSRLKAAATAPVYQ